MSFFAVRLSRALPRVAAAPAASANVRVNAMVRCATAHIRVARVSGKATSRANVTTTTTDGDESAPMSAGSDVMLSELIEQYEHRSLSVLGGRPSDVDDETWLQHVEELQAQLEVQYEQIVKEANEIMATPEWQEYRRVCDQRVAALQDEFMRDPAPVCARTVGEFHRKVDEAVSELQAHYRNKLAARRELEELERGKHLQLSASERDERIRALSEATIAVERQIDDGARAEPVHRKWNDVLTGDKLKRIRKEHLEANLERHGKAIEQRLLAGDTVRAICADYKWLSPKKLLLVRAELAERHPELVKKRTPSKPKSKVPAQE